MIKKNSRLFAGLTVLLLLFAGLASVTQADDLNQEASEKLAVVVKEIDPFVIKEEERLTGFSIDLWEELAREAELQYEYVEVETVDDQLEAVANEEADLAIAAITINSEREEIVDFSHPYYESGLQIMTPIGGVPLVSGFLGVVSSPEALGILGSFVLTLFLISNIVWFLERRKNTEEFPSSYVAGIWEAFWWAIVTVTTVGYGDKAPRSVLGRIVGMFWIMAGLFLIANFTASITTQLTLGGLKSTINSVEDLPGKAVVTVVDSTASDYLSEQRIAHSTVETTEEAYELLGNGSADAFVYDAPVLHYYASGEGKGLVQIVGEILQPEIYGIAFPLNSSDRKEINKALLDITASGAYGEINENWFGE